MVAKLISLDDSRHQVAVVTDTGIMHGIEERSGTSAEKHSIWKCQCRNDVPLTLLRRQ